MDAIEPRIRPLVDALNATGLVVTFSSCEGHFGADEQKMADRNLAYVRFLPAAGVSAGAVEDALGQWLMSYKKKHGLMPVRVIGYKLFTPLDDEVDSTYVIELHPFNRFDAPDRKRRDIDWAVERLVAVLSYRGLQAV
ncbi:hypothetical protein [Spirosoma utsteinense]|uniref:Uncharacterized protein n=1 Tax=Spirosoma utsteinense TaxID=2585773 RepID=A0ABR6W6S1_9BACT|nr:hypothetical protein [Spirosoma utsteinense]MBC3786222.1 hypothetical protein [Spirosoma utsteinense]MBC3791848.1 hypothetical protein [Spirosoma utsteinense]